MSQYLILLFFPLRMWKRNKVIYFSVCTTSLLHIYSLCIVHAKQSLFTLMWKNFKELNDLQKCIVLTLQWPRFYPVLTDSRPRQSHWCDWKRKEILGITEQFKNHRAAGFAIGPASHISIIRSACTSKKMDGSQMK